MKVPRSDPFWGMTTQDRARRAPQFVFQETLWKCKCWENGIDLLKYSWWPGVWTISRLVVRTHCMWQEVMVTLIRFQVLCNRSVEVSPRVSPCGVSLSELMIKYAEELFSIKKKQMMWHFEFMGLIYSSMLWDPYLKSHES